MFEFDPIKSAANKAKHGIDFIEAQALWNDPYRVELGVVDHDGERRTLPVGDIDGRLWTAVVTDRARKTRIISVRRARYDEEAAHERGRVRPDVR